MVRAIMMPRSKEVVFGMPVEVITGFVYEGIYFHQWDFRHNRLIIIDKHGAKMLYCEKTIEDMSDEELDEYIHLLQGIRRGFKHCLQDPRNATEELEEKRKKEALEIHAKKRQERLEKIAARQATRAAK